MQHQTKSNPLAYRPKYNIKTKIDYYFTMLEDIIVRHIYLDSAYLLLMVEVMDFFFLIEIKKLLARK